MCPLPSALPAVDTVGAPGECAFDRPTPRMTEVPHVLLLARHVPRARVFDVRAGAPLEAQQCTSACTSCCSFTSTGKARRSSTARCCTSAACSCQLPAAC
ncbi:hypothetical protein AB1Y20_014967 [Prymnesium parvum]|uniref:Uncharacterized protein n=1 Tax=Prymnesium parvum TaxID=97485 RepID=A0AB34JZD6_PRYPA